MEGLQWKKTIVFFTLDAYGHMNPILSIIKELRRRKYRAILVTTHMMKESMNLKEKGFEVEFCVGRDENKELDNGETGRIFNEIMKKFEQGVEATHEICYSVNGFVGQLTNDMIMNHDLVEAKLKSLNPDLIVADTGIGFPCVNTTAKRWVRFYSSFPSGIICNYNEWFVNCLGLKLDEMSADKKQLIELHRKAGVEKIHSFFAEKGLSQPELWASNLDLAPMSPYLNFYMGPKELDFINEPRIKPLPDIWFRLEHTLGLEEEKALAKNRFTLPENLQNKPGKLIYLSMGTIISTNTDLINRLLRMLSKSLNRFIISMGKNHEHIKLYPNMWGHWFVDQKAVLSHADLFITHGGHNSVIEAFYYGVPGLIVMPVNFDQPDAAQRIHDCGFGIRINPFKCEEEELLKSIDSLLSDEDLKKRMTEISARLGAIKYHEIAVNELERLLTD